MSGKYDLDRDLALRGLEMKTKPGMSSLNEDDVRRICREEYLRWKQQASDTELQASQASSEAPGEEGTPPWQERRVEDRRKRPEPRQYKAPKPCKDNT